MTAYPLLQILLYLSLLFAPPDATRVTITGPTPAETLELRVTVNGWAMVRDGAETPIFLSEGRLLVKNEEKYESTEVGAHVAPAKGHDWSAAPKLKLAGLTTLEKTATGYVFRMNDDGGSDIRTYTITYHRPTPVDPAAAISVNILGAVNNQGAYNLAKGATLLDALVAAGGVNRLAYQRDVRVARGLTNENATTFSINLETLRETPEKAMFLQDHDTVFVPERIF